MPKCDACGNDYDKAFQVIAANKNYTFDSFECAISTLAPACAHCKVRIVGHGLEKPGRSDPIWAQSILDERANPTLGVDGIGDHREDDEENDTDDLQKRGEDEEGHDSLSGSPAFAKAVVIAGASPFPVRALSRAPVRREHRAIDRSASAARRDR